MKRSFTFAFIAATLVLAPSFAAATEAKPEWALMKAVQELQNKTCSKLRVPKVHGCNIHFGNLAIYAGATDTLITLGQVFAQLGDKDEAKKTFEKARRDVDEIQKFAETLLQRFAEQ